MSEISGYVEQVTRQYVRGWAYDAADPARPVLIEVRVDDRVVAVGTTDQPRPDLARADTGRDTFGFMVGLPDGTPTELHRIKVRVVGSGAPIPMAEDAGVYEGFVEIFEGGSLKGWGWRCGYPEERVRIVVRHNGDVVGSSLANQLRPDLIGAGVGDGRHAFLIALPVLQKRLDPALLFAEFEATGTQLTDLRYPDRAPPPPRVVAPPRAEPAANPAPTVARASLRSASPLKTPIKTPIAARPPMARMPMARSTKTPVAPPPASPPPAATPRAMPARPIMPHPVARPAGTAPAAAVPVAPSPPVVVPTQRGSPPPSPPVAVPRAATAPRPAPAAAKPAPTPAPAPVAVAPAPIAPAPIAPAPIAPAPIAAAPAPAPVAAVPAPPAPPPAAPAPTTPAISKELYEALRGSLYFGDEGGIF